MVYHICKHICYIQFKSMELTYIYIYIYMMMMMVHGLSSLLYYYNTIILLYTIGTYLDSFPRTGRT